MENNNAEDRTMPETEQITPGMFQELLDTVMVQSAPYVFANDHSELDCDGDGYPMATDSEVQEITDLISTKGIFPFICAADDSTCDVWAVTYKRNNAWTVKYVNEEQKESLVTATRISYSEIPRTFMNSLYNLLVYSNIVVNVTSFTIDSETLESYLHDCSSGRIMYTFMHALDLNLYALLVFHSDIVCVECYHVSFIAGYLMHKAAKGTIEEHELVALREEVERNSTGMESIAPNGEEQGAEWVHTNTNGWSAGSDSVQEEFTDEEREHPVSSLPDSLMNEIMEEAGIPWNGFEVVNDTVRVDDSITTDIPATMTSEESVPDDDGEEENEESDESEEQQGTSIPVNSPTILMDDTVSRFSGADWFSYVTQQRVMIAGLGGIGSWTAMLMARMKPKEMYLIDFDTVESVNMSGQLYGREHVGQGKVDSMIDIIVNYCNYRSLYGVKERYDSSLGTADIMICGFDNMDARRTYYGAWKARVTSKEEKERKACLFIDARLNAEEFQILCIRGDSVYHMDLYETKWTFHDFQAEEGVCSYKQTSYCANMVASYMVNLFVNHCTNFCNPSLERPVPFFTYYNAEFMIFKTED